MKYSLGTIYLLLLSHSYATSLKHKFIHNKDQILKDVDNTDYENRKVLATLSQTPPELATLKVFTKEPGEDKTFYNGYDTIFSDPVTVNIDLQKVPLLGIKTKYDDGKKCEPNDKKVWSNY